MGYEQPKTVRNLIVGAALVAAGVGGHAWWTNRTDTAPETSGIAMAGNVRIMSGAEGKNFLREQAIREQAAREVRLKAADADRQQQQDAQYAAEQELQALSKPIPAAMVQLIETEGWKYFKRDLPFNFEYTVCKVHDEDSDTTYFITLSGNGENIVYSNINNELIFDPTTGNHSYKENTATIRGEQYTRFVAIVSGPVEDIIDIRLSAVTQDRDIKLNTKYSKFATCDKKTHST